MLGCGGSCRQTDTTSGGFSVLLVVLEWLQLLWIHQYIGKIKFKGRDSGGRGGSKSLIICAQQENMFRMTLKKRALLLHVASMDFQEIYFT